MKVENYRKGYTEDDLNYLYDVWGELTLNAIAKHLGRTVKGVISIAEKVGLGGYLYTETYLTTGQAADIIGVDYTTIIYWIKKDLIKARLRKIYKKKIYLIDPQDFKNFLKNNQDKWSYSKLNNTIFNENEQWLQEKRLKERDNIFFNTGSHWTVKQENELIDLIGEGYSCREISFILNRTYESIRRKRDQLINEGKLARNTKLIKDKEDKEFILTNWGKLSVKELAIATGKSEEQVAQYKWKYNLPSLYDLEEDLFTFIELGKILEVSRDTIRRWYTAFNLPATENYKGNKKRMVVNINDVIPFLEQNKDRFKSPVYEKYIFLIKQYFNDNKKEAI